MAYFQTSLQTLHIIFNIQKLLKRRCRKRFFIETSDDGVIQIEVNSSENTKSRILKVYNELYKPRYMIRISSKDFGYNLNTEIKSVPL